MGLKKSVVLVPWQVLGSIHHGHWRGLAPHRKLLKGRLYTHSYRLSNRRVSPGRGLHTHMHPRNLVRSLLGFTLDYAGKRQRIEFGDLK